MNIKKLFGKKIKEKRLRLQLTQEELAERIGISAKSLSQIELGNNFVSAENLQAICSALEVEPKQLFDFYNENDFDKINKINNKLTKNLSLVDKIYKIISIIE